MLSSSCQENTWPCAAALALLAVACTAWARAERALGTHTGSIAHTQGWEQDAHSYDFAKTSPALDWVH